MGHQAAGMTSVSGQVPKQVATYIEFYSRAIDSTRSKVIGGILTDWYQKKRSETPVQEEAHKIATTEEAAARYGESTPPISAPDPDSSGSPPHNSAKFRKQHSA